MTNAIEFLGCYIYGIRKFFFRRTWEWWVC